MLLQVIIIQVLGFLAMVFVLMRLLYSESRKEIKRLRELKEENFQKQKELQQKIEAAENVYREKVARAEDDIGKLRTKAQEEFSLLRKEILDKAKAEADHIVKAASNAKEKMREEIMLDLRKKTPVLVSQLFKEMLSDKAREIVHNELVKDVSEKIKKMDKSEFKTKAERGEFLSAFRLAKNEKDGIASLICEKVERRITFEEKEDPKLVAGVVIKIGTLMIDGSLDNRLKAACEAL